MKTNQPLSDELLDSAAAEALGANTASDSAAFQQEAHAPARRAESELRETVAKLAAASPYMAPPADLRGKILQATAPQVFRMEDYRKANADTGRFFRWGFAAACVFLAAGGWYNMTLQSRLKVANSNVKVLQEQTQGRDLAIANLINPRVNQIAIHQDNKLAAKAFVNEENKTAVVVVPPGAIPPDRSLALTLNRDGKSVIYKTIAVTAPKTDFPDAPPLQPVMNVKNIEPAATSTIYKAGLGQ